MIRRVCSALGTATPAVLVFLLVLVLSVGPTVVLGYRVYHDEAAIAALQQAEIRDNSNQIHTKAAQTEVVVLSGRVDVLASDVAAIHALLASGAVSAPDATVLAQRVATDEAQIVVLTARIAVLERAQRVSTGSTGPQGVQGPAGATPTPTPTPEHCVLRPFLFCAQGGGG